MLQNTQALKAKELLKVSPSILSAFTNQTLKKKANKINGFTLIELVIAIVIVGILAAISIPKFAALDQKAGTAHLTAYVKAVEVGAINNYMGFKAREPGSFPVNEMEVCSLESIRRFTSMDLTLSVTTFPSYPVTSCDESIRYAGQSAVCALSWKSPSGNTVISQFKVACTK